MNERAVDGQGAPGQAPLACASRAQRITLFEDRAEVRRGGRVAVPAGLSVVELDGVSALVDDASVTVAAAPDERARTLSARVVRRIHQQPAADEPTVASAERDAAAARRRQRAAQRAVTRAESALERSDALFERWERALGRAPRGLADSADGHHAAYRRLDEAALQALDDLAALRREHEQAELDLARAEQRRLEARTVRPLREALVRVQIEAREALEVELTLTYRVPCALWRPEHTARLVARPGGDGHEVTIQTAAVAWQRTGEVWRDVECRFSTARPAQSASPPLLSDDLLHMRKKSDAERRRVVVEARDQTVTSAGGAGPRARDEMPGVDDGGEPLTFVAAQPLTLPSDGRPLRSEVASLTLPCTVELVAFPERGEAAFLRATATLRGAHPLLAGPVRVARGASIVGRGRLGFVAQGEPFELGFGVEDGLRVRRRSEEQRETQALTGTQKITRTVRLFVSNLGAAPRRLAVVERVGVSELEDLTVDVTRPGGAQVDADGFVRFELEIAPHATAERAFTYRIEAAARVQLPF